MSMAASLLRRAAPALRSFVPRPPCRRLLAAQSDALGLEDVIVTKACAQRITAMCEREGKAQHLRVSVEGGGCSGFQYVFNMVDAAAPDPDDRVFERDDAKVLIDSVSLDMMRGSTIDFETELIRSGFVVLNNPNAEAGCGCGVSFGLKDDDF